MTELSSVWSENVDTVLDGLGSRRTGLDAAEVQARRMQWGLNQLPQPPRPGPLRRLGRQFNNLLIMVLLVAASITGILGHVIDTGVILAVVVINAIIGFVQEGRAEAALDALRHMLAPRANVLRHGQRQSIPGQELVPGDIVVIESGDRVPADLRLLECASLTVDEAILTGESEAVRKQIQAVAADAALGDRLNMAYSGTMVVEGHALGVVSQIGAETEIGRISHMIEQVHTLKTPLIQQMEGFARYLTVFLLLLSAAVLGFNIVVNEAPFAQSFMVVVGLFVAAIPEGLPAVLTVTLAIGVQAMARRHAIVRRLPIIETLGAVSIICSDKTGTLTRNQMVATTVMTATGPIRVSGSGYAPHGSLEGAHEPSILQALARVAALCNTAALIEQHGQWRVEGDPMEGALLAMAGKLGHSIDTRPQPEASIPFDARYRYMAVLHDGLALMKGAPEVLIAQCTQQLGPSGPEPLDTQYWQNQAGEIAAQGQRVLALAHTPLGRAELDHSSLKGQGVLLGLVGLIDPPREEAIAAVARCHEAGITVKMITGDHAGTAAAIGQQIGLKQTQKPLSGHDIDALDNEGLALAIADSDIFARTSPEHKLRLVQVMQSQGAVVAMTGDGVNDAPALKRADAGIAMGLKGSEAAREASDFVLADDNFASIVAAVEQGRTVYANLKKVITFLLPVNGGESISLIIAVLFGLLLPITPLQILWVNMVSSVALAMSLAFEPAEERLMRKPPRSPHAPILSRFILWRVLLVSVLFAIGIFSQFTLVHGQGGSLDEARTMALNSLVAMEVFYLFSVRYRHGASLTWTGIQGTPAVLIALAVVVLLQLVFTYVPFMQMLFHSVPLSPLQVAQCSVPGVALMLLLDLDKRAAATWKRRRERPSPHYGRQPKG